jgi:adenylate cyclase
VTLPESRRIILRIGINLGEVILEGSDLYGDGVNVAARLEALAEPGGVCISSKVHEEVRGKIDVAFADMGEQQLKNIAAPVRAYRLQSGVAATERRQSASNKPSIAVLPFANLSDDKEQQFFSDGTPRTSSRNWRDSGRYRCWRVIRRSVIGAAIST